MVIDGVKAGSVREVPLEWTPSEADREAGELTPSFTIALRGSLQRVNSAAAGDK